MRAFAFLALVLLAAGCHRMTAQEKAEQDARDVAAVKAAQNLHPPAQPIQPLPMNPQVRGLYQLSDAGCDFRPQTPTPEDPVLVAGTVRAIMLVGTDPMVFAVDSGSGELPSGAHAKYVGKSHWLQLTKGPGEGIPDGTARRWPGSLTIRDSYERIVYFSAGELRCGG